MTDLRMDRGIARLLFEDYGRELQHHLDEFCEDTPTRHRIQLIVFDDAAACRVEFVEATETQSVEYFQTPDPCPFRQEVQCYKEFVYIVKSRKIEQWTNLSAWHDSNDVISLVLNRNSMLSSP